MFVRIMQPILIQAMPLSWPLVMTSRLLLWPSKLRLIHLLAVWPTFGYTAAHWKLVPMCWTQQKTTVNVSAVCCRCIVITVKKFRKSFPAISLLLSVWRIPPQGILWRMLTTHWFLNHWMFRIRLSRFPSSLTLKKTKTSWISVCRSSLKKIRHSRLRPTLKLVKH